MTLDDLEKEFWGDQREQPTQVRLARVVKALREEAGPTIRMLEIQAAECFPEINERGQKHFVRVVMESAAEELKEILGDPEAATAGAIQPQGEESVRHISQEASPPETRRRSVAGPIEGPGNSAARDDQRSGTHPRAVASEDKAGRGRHVGGEGHHCLNEKAAGDSAREDEKAVEAVGDKGPVSVNSPAADCCKICGGSGSTPATLICPECDGSGEERPCVWVDEMPSRGIGYLRQWRNSTCGRPEWGATDYTAEVLRKPLRCQCGRLIEIAGEVHLGRMLPKVEGHTT